MADIISDGNIRVYAVPTIANTAAPTTAELNAGLSLQSKITADGFIGFDPDTADVDTSALDSTFNTARPGRTSFSGMMLRIKKQDGTDTTYNTLIRNYSFYVVVRRSVSSDNAWAAAQKVEVYPVVCGETKLLNPEPNTLERYEVPLKPSATPNLRATTA